MIFFSDFLTGFFKCLFFSMKCTKYAPRSKTVCITTKLPSSHSHCMHTRSKERGVGKKRIIAHKKEGGGLNVF